MPHTESVGLQGDAKTLRGYRTKLPEPEIPEPPPEPTEATILSISAYIWAIENPVDDCRISVCDDGGDVPGDVLGSIIVPGIAGGGWSTPAAPDPPITLPIGSYFWLLFERTGEQSFVTRYAISLADPSGQGEAGHGHYALDPAGFQWLDRYDGLWYTYTLNKLLTSVVFDDGHSWTNQMSGGTFPFGQGNTNSISGASKYVVL